MAFKTPAFHPHLLAPFLLGDLALPNRVVMAPMTRGRAGPSYVANQLMADYYSQRASAGLLITEGTHVSLIGRGWYQAGEIYTAAHVAGWRLTTDAVHAVGGRIFCQLWHTGRASHSSFRADMPDFQGDRALSAAPSALKRKSHGTTQKYTPGGETVPIETPRALTVEEVREAVGEFGNAARCAREAGFDGVEIHAANGYLIDEFLQSVSNHRDDLYGGSFPNRFRFLREVLSAAGEHFPMNRIGVRLSPNSTYNGMGSPDNRDAFKYFMETLGGLGVAYVHAMVGTGFVPFDDSFDPVTAADVRKWYGSGVVMVNTGYTAKTGDREIEEGNADLVAFGRPFIANPDLVERFANDWPLADPKGPETFYSSVSNHPGENGYTDYPKYEEGK